MVNSPSRLSISIVPPCCWVTTDRQAEPGAFSCVGTDRRRWLPEALVARKRSRRLYHHRLIIGGRPAQEFDLAMDLHAILPSSRCVRPHTPSNPSLTTRPSISNGIRSRTCSPSSRTGAAHLLSYFYLNEWVLNLAVAAGEEVHPPAHERDPRSFDAPVKRAACNTQTPALGHGDGVPTPPRPHEDLVGARCPGRA